MVKSFTLVGHDLPLIIKEKGNCPFTPLTYTELIFNALSFGLKTLILSVGVLRSVKTVSNQKVSEENTRPFPGEGSNFSLSILQEENIATKAPRAIKNWKNLLFIFC